MKEDLEFFTRLVDSARLSYGKMVTFRKDRKSYIERYALSERHKGKRQRVFAPLLWQYVQTIYGMMVSHHPQALVTTKSPQLKPSAANFQTVLNNASDDLGMADVLSDVFMDAMFMVGAAKMGLRGVGKFEYKGEDFEIQRPFMDTIHFDDIVIDMKAKSLEDVRYIGNYYWLDTEVFKESGLFEVPAKMKNMPEERKDGRLPDGSQSVQDTVSRGALSGQEEPLFDEVRLLDLYVPRTNKVYTFLCDKDHSKPVRTVEYDGPANPTGPYLILGFFPLPESPLFIPPVAAVADLDQYANNMMRKLALQAERTKNVGLAFGQGSTDLAEAIMNAGDGDAITADASSDLVEKVYGGVNSQIMGLTFQMMDMFNKFAGNLDLMAGTGAQSDTLGQDRMLKDSASKMLQFINLRMTGFAEKAFRHLAWDVISDPFLYEPIRRFIAGTDIEYETIFGGNKDEAKNILAYDIKITPYSDVPRTPGERAAVLDGILKSVIIPLMPLLQQQGHSVDIETALRKIYGDYQGLEEIPEIIKFRELAPSERMGPEGSTQRQMQSPSTVRTQIRKNQSDGPGNREARIMSMMGGENGA